MPQLLGFLQDFTYTPLGGADKQPLKTFRGLVVLGAETIVGLPSSLRARLAKFVLTLPPLRERPEDIPGLWDYFVANVGRMPGARRPQLKPGVRDWLCRQPWPDNIRGLDSLAHWLGYEFEGEVADVEDLATRLREVRKYAEAHPELPVEIANSPSPSVPAELPSVNEIRNWLADTPLRSWPAAYFVLALLRFQGQYSRLANITKESRQALGDILSQDGRRSEMKEVIRGWVTATGGETDLACLLGCPRKDLDHLLKYLQGLRPRGRQGAPPLSWAPTRDIS